MKDIAKKLRELLAEIERDNYLDEPQGFGAVVRAHGVRHVRTSNNECAWQTEGSTSNRGTAHTSWVALKWAKDIAVLSPGAP